MRLFLALLLTFSALVLSSCGSAQDNGRLILTNGKVYTLTWGEPSAEGVPAADAPYRNGTWEPDAEAVVTEGNKILYVGSTDEALKFEDTDSRIVDLEGATVIPGLVDSHGHPYYFGEDRGKIDLSGLSDRDLIIQRLQEQADNDRIGDWVIGFGYDEGSMSVEKLPDANMLTEAFPETPVFIIGTHGFTSVANHEAMKRAGIDSSTEDPIGGEILRDADGSPSGIFLNNAAELIEAAFENRTEEDYRSIARYGMEVMAASGYTAVHDAGTDRNYLKAYQHLEDNNEALIRIYAMLKATEEALLTEYLEKGPEREVGEMFTVRAVKAYYDASLGIRGALLLDDYSDKPGHRGISGEEYGFNEELVAKMIAGGFQLGIHAIGDAGNRDMLDFYAEVFEQYPEARQNRHRIEHAQVVHPDDFARFHELDLIASMEPPHMAEDMGWAEDRLGPERIKGAYAWRTFRRNEVPLTFNSDLTGSDHNFFYGYYAAITRKNKDRQPDGGWYPEQALRPEEALRAYTSWSAYASFQEDVLGTIEIGKLADLTILSIDVLNVGENDPDALWSGKVLGTIVNGEMVFEDL